MSTDTFEDTLRDLLRDTADAAGPEYRDVDCDAVLMHGRRLVRRRRVTTGLGLAAATVAIGLVGLVSTGALVDGAEPVPGSNPAHLSTGTATADLSRGLGDSPSGAGGSMDQPIVRVSADRATGQVTYLAGRAGAFVPIGTGQLPSSELGATWKVFEDEAGVVIGIIPAAANDHAVAISNPSGVSTSTAGALFGTNYQAVAVWPGGDTSTRVTSLSWSVGTAIYGSTTAQALNGQDVPTVVFLDRGQGVMGFLGEGSWTTRRLAEVPDDVLPTMVIRRIPAGSDTSRTTVLVVLPAGARAVEAITTSTGSDPSVETLPAGPTSDTLVLVTVTVPDWAQVIGLDRITWTNGDGSPGSGTVND